MHGPRPSYAITTRLSWSSSGQEIGADFLSHEAYMPRDPVSRPKTLPRENMLSRPIDPELTVTFDVHHLLFVCRHSYHMETLVTYSECFAPGRTL